MESKKKKRKVVKNLGAGREYGLLSLRETTKSLSVLPRRCGDGGMERGREWLGRGQSPWLHDEISLLLLHSPNGERIWGQTPTKWLIFEVRFI